jgi:hypothetical protein
MPVAGVPTLAMVDAFVGGVSILLILVIVSTPSDPRSGRVPQADIVVTCLEDRMVTVGDDPTPRTLDEIRPLLVARAPVDALSLRVLIQASPDRINCAVIARNRLRAGDDAAESDPDAIGHHFISVSIVPPEETGGEE